MESVKNDATPVEKKHQVDEIVCPACGHFTGVYERCPRCGTYLPKRASLKFFKFFSLALAIFGLFFLYLWARNQELTPIKINSITETMNFAYVRINGVVTRDARVTYDEFANVKRPSYVTFNVSDDTGDIRVTAYKKVVEELIKEDLLPCVGDLVEMDGQLRVRGTNISITLQTIKQYKLTKAPAEPIELEDLGEEYVDKNVQIKGKIVNILEPREGSRAPHTLVIKDDTTSASMVFWNDVADALKAQASFKVGAAIVAKVTVGEHRNQIQLSLKNASDIEFKDEPTTTETPVQAMTISEVGKQAQNAIVKLDGNVVSLRDFNGGRKGFFRDETGSVEIVFWNNEFQEDLSFLEKIMPGKRLQVTAKVNFYRDKVQVHPLGIKNTKIVERKITEKKLSEVNKDDINQVVIITGTILNKIHLQPGIKLILKDEENHKMGVMLFNRIFQNSQVAMEMKENDIVYIKGIVQEHKELLQVQPETIHDIRIVGHETVKPVEIVPDIPKVDESAPAVPSTKELKSEVTTAPTDSVDLSNVDQVKDHIGKQVTVQAIVVSQDILPNGLIALSLYGETSNILLIISDELFHQNVEKVAQCMEGVEIKVTGRVTVYNDTPQITLENIDHLVVLP